MTIPEQKQRQLQVFHAEHALARHFSDETANTGPLSQSLLAFKHLTFLSSYGDYTDPHQLVIVVGHAPSVKDINGPPLKKLSALSRKYFTILEHDDDPQYHELLEEHRNIWYKVNETGGSKSWYVRANRGRRVERMWRKGEIKRDWEKELGLGLEKYKD